MVTTMSGIAMGSVSEKPVALGNAAFGYGKL